MSNPSKKQQEVVKGIFLTLAIQGTKFSTLKRIKPSSQWDSYYIYVDRRLTLGYIFEFVGGAMTWR